MNRSSDVPKLTLGLAKTHPRTCQNSPTDLPKLTHGLAKTHPRTCQNSLSRSQAHFLTRPRSGTFAVPTLADAGRAAHSDASHTEALVLLSWAPQGDRGRRLGVRWR
eukprot:3612696-Pleurochrysis_carterae.AAC.1